MIILDPMRNGRLMIMMLVGGSASYLEMKPIKYWNIFFFYSDSFLKWLLLFVTFILTLTWLQSSIQLYKRDNKFFHLLTPLLGLIVIVSTLGHNTWHNAIANRKSDYEAYNYDIGSDGGLKFEFKEGGYLLGTKADRFSATFYSGTFRQEKDTLLLNISLDFPLGRHAYIFSDTLMLFKDDTTKFYLDK